MQGVVTQCGHTLSSTKPHKIAFRPAPPPNLGQFGAASVGERDGSSERKRGKMPESAISVLLRFMNRFINKHMCVCVCKCIYHTSVYLDSAFHNHIDWKLQVLLILSKFIFVLYLMEINTFLF